MKRIVTEAEVDEIIVRC